MIVVIGYARILNGQVVVSVLVGDATETQVTAVTADASLLWGEFTITIEEGPGGDISLTVGPPPEEGTPPPGFGMHISPVPAAFLEFFEDCLVG